MGRGNFAPGQSNVGAAADGRRELPSHTRAAATSSSVQVRRGRLLSRGARRRARR
jgi:hypothetical protein